MPKLEVICFLRGYSIFTIILMHLAKSSSTGLMKTALSFGGAGVHVFILVSGFGLYLSYLNHPTTYTEFLKKRFIKVYLPYLLILPAFVVFYLIAKHSFDILTLTSHVFLFKMFSHTWDTSYAYSLWFISTIIQFYLCWPLIVKLAKMKKGWLIAIVISLAWATLVGLLDKQSDRAWSSFFLQYLWEFVIGMKLGELYHKHPERLKVPGFAWLLAGAVLGMALTGVMGKMGGVLKLYNDIPSLIGYLSLALTIYQLSIPFINWFFVFADSMGYEWYLVHGLTIMALRHPLYSIMPKSAALLACLLVSFLIAFIYHKALMLIKKYERKRFQY